MKFLLVAALASLGIMGCDGPKQNSLDKLTELMTGSFSSAQQAENDSDYYDITLHMYPIWTKSETKWLYVEQTLTSTPDKPYRVRIYKVEATEEKGTFKSSVYTLKNEPDVIGHYKDPAFFDDFDESILEAKEGCAVFLKDLGNNVFEGSTHEDDCKSDFRGAAYATSKVKVEKDRVTSWDQGWNADGEQVWGAEKGGYVFKKLKE